MEENDTNIMLSMTNDEDSMTAAVVATSDQHNQSDTAVQMTSDQQLAVIDTTVSVPNEEARMVDEHTSAVDVRPPKRQKIGN